MFQNGKDKNIACKREKRKNQNSCYNKTREASKRDREIPMRIESMTTLKMIPWASCLHCEMSCILFGKFISRGRNERNRNHFIYVTV